MIGVYELRLYHKSKQRIVLVIDVLISRLSFRRLELAIVNVNSSG